MTSTTSFRVLLGSCTFALLLAAAQVQAQTPESESRRSIRTLGRLTAIKLGIENNLGLIADRSLRDAASARAERSTGLFVPRLYAEGGYIDSTPTPTTVARDRIGTAAAGVAWISPVGTSALAEVGADERLSGDAFENHGLRLRIDVSQSLLRDGWLPGASTPVREAQYDAWIQKQRFISSLHQLIVDVDTAYWQVALAQADLAIKTRSRDRAQKQFEDTRENIARGILAQGEIYIVEENLVLFEQQLVASEQALTLSIRRLAELLRLDPRVRIHATDSLDDVAFRLPKLNKSVKIALATNPELKAEKLTLDRRKATEAFADNQLLPELDISLSLLLAAADDDFGNAWSQLSSASRPEARVGLYFETPLDYGPRLANVEAAEAERQRQHYNFLETEQRVRYEVENLHTELSASAQRLELAVRRLDLAQLKLDAEVEKYQAGLTTLTDVVRFQRDWDSASIAVRQLQTERMRLRVRLLQSQGDLHNVLRVEVD